MKKIVSAYFWLSGKELVHAQFCGLTEKGSRNWMENHSFLIIPVSLAFAYLMSTPKWSLQNINTETIKKNG